eukprot:15433833-Alexandrium_andersonii.AAC.1
MAHGLQVAGGHGRTCQTGWFPWHRQAMRRSRVPIFAAGIHCTSPLGGVRRDRGDFGLFSEGRGKCSEGVRI